MSAKKVISMTDDYSEYHEGNESEYYSIYVDDGKIITCPDYYQNFSRSIVEMYFEGAEMENNHDEFGYPDQETIDKLYEVAAHAVDDSHILREIAINSLAEELIRDYDVVEITNKGLKKMIDSEFGDMFKSMTNQGLFIVKLQENAEKYNKKLILH